VSSEAQRELAPHVDDDLKDRPRAKDKDGAIELCYQLLSSGRRLDEVLAEIAPVAGTLGESNPHPDISGDAPAQPAAVPGIAQLLISKAGQTSVDRLPDRFRPAQRQAWIEAVPDDHDATAGDDQPVFETAPASAADLPAPDSGFAPQVSTDDGETIGRDARKRWFEPDGRRGAAQRIGFLLVFGALLASVPIGTFALLHLPAGTGIATGQGEASAPEQKAADGVTAASPGAATVQAAIKAPAPPSTTAVVTVQPIKAPPPNAAEASGGPPAPVMGHATAALQPVSAAPIIPPLATDHETASAIPVPNLPVHPTVTPNAVSAQRIRHEEPGLPGSELKMLVSRGDALLAGGDVTSARLFYRRAADGGDGTAALRLGETFDPAFLAQAGLGRLAGDSKTAVFWYLRAHEFGNRDADLLLKSVEPARQ
jgi:hypothetical protein